MQLANIFMGGEIKVRLLYNFTGFEVVPVFVAVRGIDAKKRSGKLLNFCTVFHVIFLFPSKKQVAPMDDKVRMWQGSCQ